MSSGGPLLEELYQKSIDYLPGRVDGRGPIGILKGAWDIRPVLQAKHIDIVHASEPRPAIMGFIASRSLSRCRGQSQVAVIWHDRGTASHFLSGRIFNLFADFVITNSDSEREKLVRNGLSAHKIRTVHNFVYMWPPETPLCQSEIKTTWGLENGEPVVGIVGRLIPCKGHRYFLEAAKTVLEQVPRARFVIVGDGPLGPDLRRRARRLGIERQVIFTGFQRKELSSLYAIMDVLVLPSTYEPFGNVSLEAMAFGKPVVASNVGGIPEVVVDGETGLLVPPGHSASLAQAVLLLLKDKELARQMGKAGRKRLRNYFTRERAIKELEQIYAFVRSRPSSSQHCTTR